MFTGNQTNILDWEWSFFKQQSANEQIDGQMLESDSQAYIKDSQSYIKKGHTHIPVLPVRNSYTTFKQTPGLS